MEELLEIVNIKELASAMSGFSKADKIDSLWSLTVGLAAILFGMHKACIRISEGHIDEDKVSAMLSHRMRHNKKSVMIFMDKVVEMVIDEIDGPKEEPRFEIPGEEV